MKELISKVDIYPIDVSLNLMSVEKQRSFFGGLISIISICLICLATWFYGKELYLKQNPIIISSLRESDQMARINVDKDNLIMMIGVQNELSVSYIDPTLFTVTASISKLVLEIDQTTGFQKRKLVTSSREIAPCDNDDIGTNELKPYFDKVEKDKYYCLKKSNDPDKDNYIEGDFDQNQFAQLFVYIKKCTNSTDSTSATTSSIVCQSEEAINKALGISKLSMFLSDSLSVPSNYEKPFQKKGINQYSRISTHFQKEIQIYYMNSYIDTDKGIFTKMVEQQNGFVFAEMREVQYYDDTSTIARVLLRIKKQKEEYIERRYEKAVSVAAQIGGILKIITMLGGFLAYPVQKFLFRNKIVHEVFDFQENEDFHDQKFMNQDVSLLYDEKTKRNQLQSNQTGNVMTTSGAAAAAAAAAATRNSAKSKFGLINKFAAELTQAQKKRSPSISNNLPSIINIPEDKQSNDLTFSRQLQTTNLRDSPKKITYRCIDYFFHFCCPRFSKNIKQKKSVTETNIQSLLKAMDIRYIINKLFEFEKLKLILLDQDQLELFESIPKPSIMHYEQKQPTQQNSSQNNQQPDLEKGKPVKQEGSNALKPVGNSVSQIRLLSRNRSTSNHNQSAQEKEMKKSIVQSSLVQLKMKAKKSVLDWKLLNIYDPTASQVDQYRDQYNEEGTTTPNNQEVMRQDKMMNDHSFEFSQRIQDLSASQSIRPTEVVDQAPKNSDKFGAIDQILEEMQVSVHFSNQSSNVNLKLSNSDTSSSQYLPESQRVNQVRHSSVLLERIPKRTKQVSVVDQILPQLLKGDETQME